eukprot:jgi/Mesvir1/26487/Mv25604-RA.2
MRSLFSLRNFFATVPATFAARSVSFSSGIPSSAGSHGSDLIARAYPTIRFKRRAYCLPNISNASMSSRARKSTAVDGSAAEKNKKTKLEKKASAPEPAPEAVTVTVAAAEEDQGDATPVADPAVAVANDVASQLADLYRSGQLDSAPVPLLRSYLKKKYATTTGKKAELITRATRLLAATLGPAPQGVVTEAAVATAAVTATDAKTPTGRASKKTKAEAVVTIPYTASLRPPPPPPGTKTLKILAWNINGIRALLKKGSGGAGGEDEEGAEEGAGEGEAAEGVAGAGSTASALRQLVEEEGADILCLQETKLQERDVESVRKLAGLAGFMDYWSCSNEKKGYSGTAIFCKHPPLSVRYGIGLPEHDDEGRVITVELEDCFLVAAYVPNAGQKLERLTYRTESWDPAFRAYLKGLEAAKPVILTGDLNCSHREIDIHNPKGNLKSSGFTAEERASFDLLLASGVAAGLLPCV